jgi:hypothetical protein
MNKNEVKKISAEYVVWVIDITKGEMTFPDGKKKKVNFFRRSKTRCTLSWDIPHFLNKALDLLTQLEWKIDLKEKGTTFNHISFNEQIAVDEYYYRDEDDNFVDVEFASAEFVPLVNEEISIIYSHNGIHDLKIIKNNDNKLCWKTNKEKFIVEFKELLATNEDKFLQIKRVLEHKGKHTDRIEFDQLNSDPIPF